jgi:hypothetical protein
VGAHYEALTNPDAKEIVVDGRIIRVIDEGYKVKMVRKGWVFTNVTTDHWEDFIIAGKKATGCDMINLIPYPGTGTALVFVQAMKQCKK